MKSFDSATSLLAGLHPPCKARYRLFAARHLLDRGALAKSRLAVSLLVCIFAGLWRGIPAPLSLCSVTQLETDMDTALSQTTSEVDFSFSVERQDSRRYNFNRGASTFQTSYESASTSKLVSAVIILRLVEQGYLNLTDKPQDWVFTWPISNSDSLFNVTLAHLLSFTSGLTAEPFCLNFGIADFETCVTNIATTNASNGITPGHQFYYASTHLQVAGLMAIKARGFATWQDVFGEFKTSLFRLRPTIFFVNRFCRRHD